MNNAFTNGEFNALMQRRIRRVLLVCSLYDQFAMEEDGRIEEILAAEYNELGLTEPPTFVRATTAEQALRIFKRDHNFDIVITMFNIGTTSAFDLARRIKTLKRTTPVILLTSVSHEVTRRLHTDANASAIDYVFASQGNADVMLAIIKMLEDKANAAHDMLKGNVQGILLVEDSVKFYSAYLHDLYEIVIRQTNDFAVAALNTKRRNMLRRARPKILFARNYDEAQKIYRKYNKNLFGVICDVSFRMTPTDAEVTEQAGLKFCSKILADNPQLPVLIQSSDPSNAVQATKLGADFLNKNASTLLDSLEQFIRRRMAFGRFQFIDPATETVIAEAENLDQLHHALHQLPTEVLLYYARQNMFSKWLYSRGLFTLAKVLKALTVNNFDSADAMRNFLIREVETYRGQLGEGVISDFDPKTYTRYIAFARSGHGSLGGKARGLAFINKLLEQYNLYDQWTNVRVMIPRTLVVTTNHFDHFIAENALGCIADDNLSDSELLSEFIGARLSDTLVDHLRTFIATVHRPLAVRSSSKLEDSHYQPFAGIYSTYMIPYSENPDRMLRMVLKAVKSVYASVYYASSKRYIETSDNILSEEKMAVLVQEMCGSEQNGLFFPTLSGVARSINMYPLGNEESTDGICDIAAGLGKMVVEGNATFRFSPKAPKHALQLSSPDIARHEAQRYLYALNTSLASLRTATDDGVNLVKADIQTLADFRQLRFTASTWDMQDNRMADTLDAPGQKVISFAPILKYDLMPVAEIIDLLLTIGAKALNSPVEIEFAINMDVPKDTPYIFNVLQIRPITETPEQNYSPSEFYETTSAILTATHAMGPGKITGITDVIYVRPQHFDAAQTVTIASEISELNSTLSLQHRSYVLIGPGRWGSSDRWLGIPVKWADISGAGVIAECGLPDFSVDPSQGTHFFHNITSLGVGYVTLNPAIGSGTMAFDVLDQIPALYESHFLRHVRFGSPLRIIVDGRSNKAIITP